MPSASTSSSTKAGGDPLYVGLHHHRVESLVDAAAQLEEGGEEASLSELGYLQGEIPGLGREWPLPVSIALIGSGLGALVALGPYLGSGLGFDERLQYEFRGTADEVERIAVFQHGGDLVEGRLV